MQLDGLTVTGRAKARGGEHVMSAADISKFDDASASVHFDDIVASFGQMLT